MKKLLFSLVLVLSLFLVGCEEQEQGKYNEGTYFGHHEFNSRGNDFVTTAVVYVSEDGNIESVFIDTTYVQNEVNTTKKALGEDYGMRETSANIGVIEGGAEWYEQIEVLEEHILKNQGLDWIEWSNEEETETDSVSGVTVTIDTYYAAVEMALNEALN